MFEKFEQNHGQISLQIEQIRDLHRPTMIFNCLFLSQNSGSTVKAVYFYDPIPMSPMRCLNFHVSFKMLIVYIIHTCVCVCVRKNLERLLRDAFRMNKFIKKINSSFYPIMIQNFTD